MSYSYNWLERKILAKYTQNTHNIAMLPTLFPILLQKLQKQTWRIQIIHNSKHISCLNKYNQYEIFIQSEKEKYLKFFFVFIS